MSKDCKGSYWSCCYHACMSDNCQKIIVVSQGYNWGAGACEELKHESIFKRLIKRRHLNEKEEK